MPKINRVYSEQQWPDLIVNFKFLNAIAGSGIYCYICAMYFHLQCQSKAILILYSGRFRNSGKGEVLQKIVTNKEHKNFGHTLDY